MTINIEIEAKALIDKNSYESLCNGLEKYIQTNYYIDSEKFVISSKHLGLRIRLTNNKYELTLKEDLSEGRRETNQIIGKGEFEDFVNLNIFPDGDVKEKLISFQIDIKTLKIFAVLKCSRCDLKYKTSIISIDKSEYNNLIDYEIEAEDCSLKQAKENLECFLKEKNIPFKWNTITKLKRVKDSL